MTRLYSGIDLLEIARLRLALQRHGDRFVTRVYTAQEQRDCGILLGVVPSAAACASLAARWAAKEAFAKAVGIGLRGLPGRTHTQVGLAWTDIEIVRQPGGKPFIALHPPLRTLLQRLDLAHATFDLSMSHTRDYAVAQVVGLAAPAHVPGQKLA